MSFEIGLLVGLWIGAFYGWIMYICGRFDERSQRGKGDSSVRENP